MPNRTMCDVLDAMRNAYETRNFSYLLGLIEEAQDMANRMESALYDKRDYRYEQKQIKELKTKRRKLRRQVDKLEAKIDELTDE